MNYFFATSRNDGGLLSLENDSSSSCEPEETKEATHASCESQMVFPLDDCDGGDYRGGDSAPQRIPILDNIFEINQRALSLYNIQNFEASSFVLRIGINEGITFLDRNNEIQCHALTTLMANAGQVYWALGQYWKALYYAKEALGTYSKGLNKKLLALLHFNVGYLLYMAGNSARLEAKTHFHESQRILSNRFQKEGSYYDLLVVQSFLILIEEEVVDSGDKPSELFDLVNEFLYYLWYFGHDHESIFNQLQSLARMCLGQKKYDYAIGFIHAISSKAQEGACYDDKDAILETLVNLGRCYQAQGNYDLALTQFRKVVHLKRETIMGDSPEIQQLLASVLYDIGTIHEAYGPVGTRKFRRRKALRCYKVCLDLRRLCLPADDLAIADVLHDIARVLVNGGKISKGLKYLEESVLIRKHQLQHNRNSEGDNMVAFALSTLGRIYRQRGELAKALSFFIESLSWLRQSPLDDNMLNVLLNLAQVQHYLGHMDCAMKSYQEAVMILRNYKSSHHGYGEDSRRQRMMVQILNNMACLELDRSNMEAAKLYFAEAVYVSGGKRLAMSGLEKVHVCAAAA